MNKWMPISGNFVENGKTITFQGAKEEATLSSKNSTLFPSVVAPEGLILFKDIISNGSISVSIKFNEFAEGDMAKIVFNYLGPANYMCAGISNLAYKYIFSARNIQENILCSTGNTDSLPSTSFDMRLNLVGSYLEPIPK